MKTVEQKVIKFISENSLLKKGDKLLIGLSGGPDSVFALKFFIKYKKKYSCEIIAVHINHHLRDRESKEDQNFCERLCESEGIELISRDVDVKLYSSKKKISIEEAARVLRYQAFEEIAGKYECTKIITAHNMSDNTETVILNLVKGTGIKGLSGIPVKRGYIIRPLLVLKKEEIFSYLERNGIAYRLDSSNESLRYQRNFIRNELIPGIKENLNPSVDNAVFRMSQNLNRTDEILRRQINEIVNNEIIFIENEIRIPASIYKKYGHDLTSEIIRNSLKQKYTIEIDFKDIEKVTGIFSKQVGKSVELKGGIECRREREQLIISQKQPGKKIFKKLRLGSSVNVAGKKLSIEKSTLVDAKKRQRGCEYIDSKNLLRTYELRNWETGDKFMPLGMNNFKKVSDFLTDSKVKASGKKEKLVLLNRNQIVWVVGLRIDNRFKITDQTRETVKLCLK